MRQENVFYHQSTTVFLTMKRVFETERELCKKIIDLGPGNEQKRQQLELGITQCRDNYNNLEVQL